MSTSNLRVIAAGVAAIVAVLTGVIAGWVGAQTATSCPARPAPAQTTAASTPQPNQGKPQQPTPRQPDEGQHTFGQGDHNTGAGSNPAGADEQAAGGEQKAAGGEKQAAGGARQTGQAQAADLDCDQPSFSVRTAAVGFLGAALAGGVAMALLLAGRRRDTAGGMPVASAPPAAGADPGLGARAEHAEAERAGLVKTCIYVRDRATSKAIADALGRSLAEVGVTAVEPVGVRFDPAHHEAGGATPTADPARVGIIAAVEVPGYIDRGVILRAPVVTVYREGAGQ